MKAFPPMYFTNLTLLIKFYFMFIEESLKKRAKIYFKSIEKHMGIVLGIEFEHLAKDKFVASMPVDERTIQPFGILHGGASVVLAETLASVGGWFLLNDVNKTVVGIEINANHIRSVKKGGKVTGTAKPLNIGRNIQVWEISITNERGKLVCSSRCTLAVIGI